MAVHWTLGQLLSTNPNVSNSYTDKRLSQLTGQQRLCFKSVYIDLHKCTELRGMIDGVLPCKGCGGWGQGFWAGLWVVQRRIQMMHVAHQQKPEQWSYVNSATVYKRYGLSTQKYTCYEYHLTGFIILCQAFQSSFQRQINICIVTKMRAMYMVHEIDR